MEKALIEQARNVSIVKILDSRGIKIARQSGDDYYYLSPLRVGDKVPSFHVNAVKNRWYDFGLKRGRDSIQLIMELDSINFPLAVKYLLQFEGVSCTPLFPSSKTEIFPASEKRKEISERDATQILIVQTIKHHALIDYLEERCIPLDLANLYLKEVHFYLSKKQRKYFTLGFPSGNGFVTRNSQMPGFVGKNKAISFVPGTKNLEKKPNDKVMIFEGFFDFLASLVLANKDRFEEDVIILHSVAMTEYAKKMITEKKYQTVLLCLDNDRAGQEVVLEFQKMVGLRVIDCSERYSEHKDINEYLIKLQSKKYV